MPKSLEPDDLPSPEDRGISIKIPKHMYFALENYCKYHNFTRAGLVREITRQFLDQSLGQDTPAPVVINIQSSNFQAVNYSARSFELENRRGIERVRTDEYDSAKFASEIAKVYRHKKTKYEEMIKFYESGDVLEANSIWALEFPPHLFVPHLDWVKMRWQHKQRDCDRMVDLKRRVFCRQVLPLTEEQYILDEKSRCRRIDLGLD